MKYFRAAFSLRWVVRSLICGVLVGQAVFGLPTCVSAQSDSDTVIKDCGAAASQVSSPCAARALDVHDAFDTSIASKKAAVDVSGSGDLSHADGVAAPVAPTAEVIVAPSTTAYRMRTAVATQTQTSPMVTTKVASVPDGSLLDIVVDHTKAWLSRHKRQKSKKPEFSASVDMDAAALMAPVIHIAKPIMSVGFTLFHALPAVAPVDGPKQPRGGS